MAAEIAQRARALPRHAEPVVVGRIARPGDEGEKRIAVTDQREVATQLDPAQVAERAVRDHRLPLAELRQARKSVWYGQSWSVSVALRGGRTIKKHKHTASLTDNGTLP